MSAVDAEEVIILRVGAAGGCLELVGVQDHIGWRFRVRTNEAALSDEHDFFYVPPRPWVRSWHEALGQLETYPWRVLIPEYVEPAFRAQIVEALNASTTQSDAIDWKRWDIVLG